jgi:hypothetical protein
MDNLKDCPTDRRIDGYRKNIKTESEKDGQMGRQRDRQPGRQIGSQTQMDGRTDKQT